MNALSELLGSPVVVAIGTALLHLLWQGAIVAALTAAVLELLAKSSANARYLVACAALVTLVVLGGATAVQVYEPRPTLAPAPQLTPSSLYVPTTVAEIVTTSVGSWREAPKMLIRPLVPWAFALWLSGVLLLTLRLTGGWLRIQRICRVASDASEQLQMTVGRLSARMGLHRPVRVVASSSFDVPVVIGWLRPVLLFPITALSGLSPQQVETIVAHELAHIRRHDYFVNLMQTFVETLLFYHPAVWWLSSRIRAEREHCCDDVVVETCGNAVLYARALTDLEELRSRSTGHAMAATGGSLRTRVVRIIGGHHGAPAHRLVSGAAIGIAILTVTIVAPLSLLAHQRQAREEKAGSTITVTGESESARTNARSQNLVAELLFGDGRAVPVPPQPEETELPLPEDPGVPDAPAVSDPGVPDAPPPPAVAYAFATGDLDFDFTVDDEAIDTNGRGPAKRHASRDRKRSDRKLSDGALTVDELVQLKATGVTSAYVASLEKAGYADLTLDELSQMAAHDVDAAYIEAMNGAGYGKLSVGRLIAARIHDLTPAFVEESRRRFGALPFDEMLALRIHDVTPEQVAELEKLFGKLKLGNLLALTIHDVDRKYIDDLARAGVTGLTADQALAFAALGIDDDYIDELRSAGFANLSADELLKMKALGVDGEYMRDLSKEKAKNSSRPKKK